MLHRLWTALAALALGLTLSFGVAQEKLKSGPQVGTEVPGPFHPLNVTGEAAGTKKCLYCAYGGNPVAVVFARELTPGVKSLIKQIDQATEKHQAQDLCSFAVFCSDNEKLADDIKSFASKEKVSKMILAIDNPAGPQNYSISKDADVTVFFYEGLTVKSNHAFRRGELNEAAVARILADVKTILPTK
jgi:hypothetical protein